MHRVFGKLTMSNDSELNEEVIKNVYVFFNERII
jgi:hypothetical protein